MKQNTKWILVLRVNKTLSSKKPISSRELLSHSCQEEAGFRWVWPWFCLRLLNRRLLFKVYVFTGYHVIDFRQIHWPTEAWFSEMLSWWKKKRLLLLVLWQWRIRGRGPGGLVPPYLMVLMTAPLPTPLIWRAGSVTVWFCCHCERSKMILVEIFSDMRCLEDNASWNCQTNTVTRSV